MKRLGIILISLFFSVSFYGQKVNYSVEVGGGVDFMTFNHFPKSSFDYIDYSSKPKSVFYLNNYFIIPVNKTLSFKTGFGISINRLNQETSMPYSITPYDWGTGHSNDNNHGTTIDSILVGSIYLSASQKLEQDFSMYLLRIPLQLQFSLLKERLLLSSGISISYLLDAKVKSSALPAETVLSANNQFHNSFTNVNVGFEYRVWKGAYLGLLYEYSISEIMPYFSSYYYNYRNDYYKFHLNSASLNISYRF